ncbi:MAG TPA: hypothetical protein VGE05_15355 [Novosphingobium sp.]
MRFTAIFLALWWSAATANAQVDADRAIRNYRDVASGHRQLGQLTPFERQEVAEVDRILRTRKIDKRTPKERCIQDEISRSDGETTYLERRVIELKCSGY